MPWPTVLLSHHFLPPARTKSGALPTALLLSTVVASLFAVVANRYLAIPMYVRLYKIPLGAILKMASATNPLVHSLTDFPAAHHPAL